MKDTKTLASLNNFKKAIESLRTAVEKQTLSDLELAGAIQNFEFCYEMSWKTLKKYAASQGRTLASPREAFQFAWESQFVVDEKLWLAMIEDRNRTTHTYDRASAEQIYLKVKAKYFQAFETLYEKLTKQCHV